MSIQSITEAIRTEWDRQFEEAWPQEAKDSRSFKNDCPPDSDAEEYQDVLFTHLMRELFAYREDRYEDDNLDDLETQLSVEAQIYYIWWSLLGLDRESIEFKISQHGNIRTCWKESMTYYSNSLRSNGLLEAANALDRKVQSLESPIAVMQWVTNLVEQHSN